MRYRGRGAGRANPGPHVGGIFLSGWDPIGRIYADPTPVTEVDGMFDLRSPAVAVQVGAGQGPAEFWTFGGLDGNGVPVSAMWHGESEASTVGGDFAAGYRLAPVARQPDVAWPAERSGAVLAVRGPARSTGPIVEPGLPASFPAGLDGDDVAVRTGLVLAGGRGMNGLLDDVWFFDGVWRQVATLSGVGAGLADAGAALAKERLWLAGGETGVGITADIRSIDLYDGFVEHFPAPATGPPPGRRYAVTYDDVRDRLLLFGAEPAGPGAPAGVWAFRPDDGSWSVAVPPCSGSACPAATGRETLVVEPVRGDITLVADPAGPDADVVVWTFREGVWQTLHEASGVADPPDCDGDGAADPLWGARCGSETAGFPDYGRLRCGSALDGLVCRRPLRPGTVLAGYRIAGLRSVDAASGRAVTVAGRRLEVWRPRPDGSLESERSVPLRRTGLDVHLWRSFALVGDDGGLVMISLVDGTTVGAVPTCGPARRVLVEQDHALVVGLHGIVVVSLDEQSGPAIVQDVRLRLGWWGRLVAAPASGGCSVWLRLIDAACDLLGPCRWSRSFPGTVDRRVVYVSMLGSLWAVDFTAGWAALPGVGAGTPVGLVRDIAVEGRHLYYNNYFGGGAVLDRSLEGPWPWLGPHDVRRWVQGVAADRGVVFLAEGDRLHVGREQ